MKNMDHVHPQDIFRMFLCSAAVFPSMTVHQGEKRSRKEQEVCPEIENAAIIGTLRTPPSDTWNISNVGAYSCGMGPTWNEIK